MPNFGNYSKKMKAGIFDPYLDTLGGGERYCLTLAEYLLREGWQVDLFWDGREITQIIKERMDINIERVNFVPEPTNLINKLVLHRKYDLLFYVSDGSIPFMFGKKNLLHLQVPFSSGMERNYFSKLKLNKIKNIICNSIFTKQIVEERLGVKTQVVYPPVAIEKFYPGKKENLILSVGRFSRLLQEKKHDILIASFKKLFKTNLPNWRLTLVGGSDVGGKSYVEELKSLCRGYPIEVLENLPFRSLISLYARAKIFWAASGFSVDEKKYPEKVEHFGISVVEAMAAGAVPLIVKKGGFKEIVENGRSGFFWESQNELEKKTVELATINLEKFQLAAANRAKNFSKENFYERYKEIIFG